MQRPKYDILRETWIYQEIKQEVLCETQAHFLQLQRQLLIEIVETRFPRLLSLATSVVAVITDIGTLHTIIISISKARLEKEARQCLSEVGDSGEVKDADQTEKAE
jgi:hypothetical protein